MELDVRLDNVMKGSKGKIILEYEKRRIEQYLPER